ncbi:MAG TPA: N-acetyltransferase [Blastocatellia bacterium]|nr:N-acetyltransferase [Blastocatellia bacterium]
MTRSTATRLDVRPARTAREQKQFLNLPYRLHRHQEHWIAPLRMAQKDMLDTAKHPFYKTAEVEKFLAWRGGRVVGRVMAILNRAHNEFHGERAGFFGFFEAEEDYEAAAALLDAARAWLKGRGAEVMRGPVNPSTNYECGLLVEGFDLDPTLMMVWNPAYYGEFLERYGLRKAADLYAYDIAADYFNVSDKLKRVAERLQSKERVRVRPVNLKEFKSEVEIVRRVYNDAWSRNWGFVPVTNEEFEHLGKDLKQLVDPRVVLIAEQHTPGSEPRPIGFMLAVPDLNRALKKMSGRLFPFGLIKLLWHSRKINTIRIITMGVVREFQSLGGGAIFLKEIYERAPAAGFPSGEMSWVLDNNVMMNRAAELIGGRRTKTYRIYEMPLAAS